MLQYVLLLLAMTSLAGSVGYTQMTGTTYQQMLMSMDAENRNLLQAAARTLAGEAVVVGGGGVPQLPNPAAGGGPSGGGLLPTTALDINGQPNGATKVLRKDSFGIEFGYCKGAPTNPNDPMFAIIAAGFDKTITTDCTAALAGGRAGDDLVRMVSLAEGEGLAQVWRVTTGGIETGAPTDLTTINTQGDMATGGNLTVNGTLTVTGATTLTTTLGIGSGGTGATSAAGAVNNIVGGGLGVNGLVARTGAASVAARTLTGPSEGITVSNGDGAAGDPTLALGHDLAAVEGLTTSGIAVRTGTSAWATRQITIGGGANALSVTNGTGVAGDIAIGVDAEVEAIADLDATAGVLAQTGAGAFAKRTLTGTANEITVTNGTGAAGNPTLSLPASVAWTNRTMTGGANSYVGTSGAPLTEVRATTIYGALTGNVTGNVSGTAGNVTGVVGIPNGGTGQTTAPLARTALGADDATNLTTGTLPAARLPTSGVTASTYGSASMVPQIQVDATGRITSASNVAIAIAGSQITSGTVGTGVIGSGTANSSTFLRGDSTWQPISSIDGSFGQNTSHGALLDLNTDPGHWGWTFVQGTTNSPHTGTQAGYRARIGMGSEYSRTQYAMELLVPRAAQGGNGVGYLFTRQQEGGTWGGWAKIKAGTADTWTTARTISLSTDASGSVSLDGSGNVTLPLTLANSGVTANTYGSASTVPVIQVDAKGRITSANSTAISIGQIGQGDSSVGVVDSGSGTTSLNVDGGGAEMTVTATGISTTVPVTINATNGAVGLTLNNNSISGVNGLTFADPGPGEGVTWANGNNWKIFESPDDLTTDAAGNLQFVQNTTRRFTVDTAGDVWAGSNKIWHAGNDGTGSTLDADRLDNIDSADMFYNGKVAGYAGPSGADWLNAINNGVYQASGAANVPEALPQTWWYGLVLNHRNDSAKYNVQYLTNFDEPNLYIRTNSNGTWRTAKVWTDRNLNPSNYQPADPDLTGVGGLTTTGLVTRTGSGTFVTRAVGVTASTGLSVTNGDGVAGAPTLAGVAMTGATGVAAGTMGMVPQPVAGDNTKYLRGDGTWQTLSANAITQGDSSVTVTDSGANGTITFRTDNVQRAQIDSAGNLIHAGHITLSNADPYIRNDSNDQHIVLSGGSGWNDTGAVMVLHGNASSSYAGGARIQAATTGTGRSFNVLDFVNGSYFSNTPFLQVAKSASDVRIEVNGDSGYSRYFRVAKGATARWDIGADAAAESGSNAGSNFYVSRFNDAGVWISSPIRVDRVDGRTTLEKLTLLKHDSTNEGGELNLDPAQSSHGAVNIDNNTGRFRAFNTTSTSGNKFEFSINGSGMRYTNDAGTLYSVLHTGNGMPIAGMADNTDQYVNFRVMRNANSSSNNDGMYIGYGNSNSGATRIYGGGSTATPEILVASGAVTVNGTLTVTTSVTTPMVVYTSDERLKDLVGVLDGDLKRLASLRTIRYRWNEEARARGLHDERVHLGVLAQDVEAVYPEAVITGEDGVMRVDYAALVVPLISATKELEAANDNLKKENRQLSERTRALEDTVAKLVERVEALERRSAAAR